MNEKNIKSLISFLETETEKHKFAMGHWLNPRDKNNEPTFREEACGTSACIGGTCEFLAVKEKHPEFSITEILDEIDDLRNQWENTKRIPSNIPYFIPSVYLGILKEEAEELTHPYQWPSGNKAGFTRESAIKILRNLLDTGTVDWTIAIPSYKRGKEEE